VSSDRLSAPVRVSAPVVRYAAAALSIAIAGWFLLESLPLLPAAPGSNDVGPGAAPALAAMLLAVAGIIVAFQANEAAPEAAEVHEPLRVVSALLLLLAFVVALASTLNAWVVITAFVLAMQLVLGEWRWTWLVGGTGLLVLTIWFLFGYILAVPL
jgi:hypothetical protein